MMRPFLCLSALCLFANLPLAAQELKHWEAQILDQNPAAYWSFENWQENQTTGYGTTKSETFPTTMTGKVLTSQAGPAGKNSFLFHAQNKAIAISQGKTFLRVKDPGENSPLDFTAGDTLSIEAWVNPSRIAEDQQVYIIGKGRTLNKGTRAENQNYALRLRGINGRCCLSFLFRGVDPKTGKSGYYRWNSSAGFAPKTGWHHVAITYTFGKKTDPQGWIDGKPTSGSWDMGSATTFSPLADNDEVWIGSSMGGNPSSTFMGLLDEIAIYRGPLPKLSLENRVIAQAPPPALPEDPAPKDAVRVEIFENIPDAKSWNFSFANPEETYLAPRFAFLELPRKYSAHGIQIDRSNPVAIRASSRIVLPAGKYRVLLRARNGARVFVDERPLTSSAFHSINGNAHGNVRHVARVQDSQIRQLQTGDNEVLTEFVSDGKLHEWTLDVFLGGGKKRPELGETSLSFASIDNNEKVFRILGHGKSFAVTERAWQQLADADRVFLRELNAERRRTLGAPANRYWNNRHEFARSVLAETPTPKLPSATSLPEDNFIDRYINSKLQAAGKQPTELIDDLRFLKRLSLDTNGTIPSAVQIKIYLETPAEERRTKAIARFLAEPGWADHWVGYWQDLLAENPNIINPTLNNTGPFRWWIHESFLDNKPFDRFASELITMQGSQYYGGPGGFEMATQNDVPMAAKAHVISQAFLGVNMKCARCHDAPFHDLTQRDLFSIAAMLKRGPQGVPKTSTVPVGAGGAESLLVKVDLKPGEQVAPQWPFAELSPQTLPEEYLQSPADQREQLAALMTSPENERFAKVIVNRLWHRYLGYGLVNSLDDWEHAQPSHPELLDHLAREFVLHDYDLKHLASLIFHSRLYQRETVAVDEIPKDEPFLFAGPVRRRLTAEQLVDSIFVASGKPLHAGALNIDADGSRLFTKSLNLGRPVRAWEFTSLSNERDRPSLSLPLAQPFVTTLKTFGWRVSRQDPVSERDETITVLQPAILANGILSARFTRLSEDSAFTELALRDIPLSDFVTEVFLQTLSRHPNEQEAALFTELLRDGYDERINRNYKPEDLKYFRSYSTGVSWSNHLSPEANEAQVAQQAYVRKGEPPTIRLHSDWRERTEDMLWTLLNTPEFLFVP